MAYRTTDLVLDLEDTTAPVKAHVLNDGRVHQGHARDCQRCDDSETIRRTRSA